MTDQLPERIWIYEGTDGRDWSKSAGYDGPYLRADTCIPKAEADAMVAAAVDKAAIAIDRIAQRSYLPEGLNEAKRDVLRLKSADASAAFEQAVQEAVEAERDRIVKIVASYVGCENIVAAIRAPQETSE